MRIAMIGQKDVPSRLGGVEIAVGALAVRMAAKGHHVTLYNCHRYNFKNRRKKLLHTQYYKGVCIREIQVPDVKGVSAALGSMIATVCAVAAGGYDCIHFHAEGPALMCILPHMFGIRTVVTIHGLDWKRSKWGPLASWYLKLGERTAVRFADELIVLSRDMQKYFRENYQRETLMIPNGIERPVKRPADEIRKKWGLEQDGYILYLGRIVPEKGIQYLISAFQRVETDKKLVIAGGSADTDEYYMELKRAAKSDPRIIFSGFVWENVLAELYSNCYLYCLPSEMEGLPISLLEALSYENCCVCSDIPECVEVIGTRGYLFHSRDNEDLRRILQMLCKEPERVVHCRSKADEFLYTTYNWDAIVKKTLAVYRRNLDDRGEH